MYSANNKNKENKILKKNSLNWKENLLKNKTEKSAAQRKIVFKFSGSRFSIKIIAHSTTHRANSDVPR